MIGRLALLRTSRLVSGNVVRSSVGPLVSDGSIARLWPIALRSIGRHVGFHGLAWIGEGSHLIVKSF